jgi:hypothetical protein
MIIYQGTNRLPSIHAQIHLHSHPPGTSATAIALGMMHTCIIATGGGAKCWGYNGNGQLGIGSTSNTWSPVDVDGA